ncbi:hypothetical protein BC937DRAFT_90477 [Endogone sp. FLAS-F59071]|nr:hypothetical protein BC937DRAFT_90477 [Endogone sp. FLAS-F59071]|eukprot:RUS17052.1 hypothetical protein BC937DRAFT_90477 [Endogone sp. FLAS-F59071]
MTWLDERGMSRVAAKHAKNIALNVRFRLCSLSPPIPSQMFLAITVLLLVIITEGILWFGYSYITALAYGIYLELQHAEKLKSQRALKKQILQIKAELGRISTQDEFARWAKQRRKLDSGVADLEKLNSDLAFIKTAFELKFTSFLYFLVHGVQILMVLSFRGSPMFYLPRGWFGPFEWVLALPFAPKGSVSVAIWFVICRRVCKSIVQIAASFLPEGTTEVFARAAGAVVKQVQAWRGL